MAQSAKRCTVPNLVRTRSYLGYLGRDVIEQFWDNRNESFWHRHRRNRNGDAAKWRWEKATLRDSADAASHDADGLVVAWEVTTVRCSESKTARYLILSYPCRHMERRQVFM